MKKIIAVVGPTAVGKSDFAVELAKQIDGEIISCDSTQVYRQLNIGVAKINEKEKDGIVHHLINIVDYSQDYSVARYQNDARNIIDKINQKGKTAIIVGGTGLYLKACLYDYIFVKEENKFDFDQYLEYDNLSLYNLLKELDPISAEKIHPNNRRRITRAIEIAKSSSLNKTQLLNKQNHQLIYPTLFIGLTFDRKLLYQKINNRVEKMISNGLVEEVKSLYNQTSKDYLSLNSIGYKEIIDYLKGNISLEVAIELIKLNTRRYAKKQYTWFNNQFNVEWFDLEIINYNYQEIIEYVLKNI